MQLCATHQPARSTRHVFAFVSTSARCNRLTYTHNVVKCIRKLVVSFIHTRRRHLCSNRRVFFNCAGERQIFFEFFFLSSFSDCCCWRFRAYVKMMCDSILATFVVRLGARGFVVAGVFGFNWIEHFMINARPRGGVEMIQSQTRVPGDHTCQIAGPQQRAKRAGCACACLCETQQRLQLDATNKQKNNSPIGHQHIFAAWFEHTKDLENRFRGQLKRVETTSMEKNTSIEVLATCTTTPSQDGVQRAFVKDSIKRSSVKRHLRDIHFQI